MKMRPWRELLETAHTVLDDGGVEAGALPLRIRKLLDMLYAERDRADHAEIQASTNLEHVLELEREVARLHAHIAELTKVPEGAPPVPDLNARVLEHRELMRQQEHNP